MSSWKIDPKNGDYVMSQGKPISTEDLGNPAYYRIKIGRKRWLYAPDDNYGSDLATLKKKTGNAALGMVGKALQPIVDDGRALAVDSAFSDQVPAQASNAEINVTITDANGTQHNLNLPPIGA